MDFFMLEMEHAGKILIILGWPFLAAIKENINIANGTITLMVDEKEVEFSLHGIATTPLVADDQTYFRD